MSDPHFIADDLGYPRDHGVQTSFRAIDGAAPLQTWIGRADEQLATRFGERLSAECRLDEIDEARP